jgi:transcriptional regulator, XRE family
MRHEEEEIIFEKSSGNVFRDLELPNAEERLEKANLAYEIFRTIRDRGLTQRKAAEIMGIDQPKISAIVRGNLKGFSLERLIALLKKLGVDVHIAKRTEVSPSIYTNPSTLPIEAWGNLSALFGGISIEVAASQYMATGSIACMETLAAWASTTPVSLNNRDQRERPENEPAPLAA